MAPNPHDFERDVLSKNDHEETKCAFIAWAEVLDVGFFQRATWPYGNTTTDRDYYIKLCSYGREVRLLRIMCAMSEERIAHCMNKYLTKSNGIKEHQLVAFRLWASAYQPYYESSGKFERIKGLSYELKRLKKSNEWRYVDDEDSVSKTYSCYISFDEGSVC